jgi:fucose permease
MDLRHEAQERRRAMSQTVFPEQNLPPSGPVLRWQMGLIFLGILLLGTNDGAIGILIPSLRAQYHLDTGSVGAVFLFSSIGSLLTALCNGLLVERLGQRAALLLGTAAFFCSVALVSLAPPFAVVLALLLLQGCGGAIIDVGCNASLVQAPRGTTLLNYLHATHGIGALLGPLLASTMVTSGLGWNRVYVAWAAMSLVVLVGLAATFKGAPRSREPDGRTRNGTSVAVALKTRIIWISALFFLVFVGLEFSLGSWSYSFLINERQGSPLLMGWIVSGYWLGVTAGRLALARSAQRVGEKRLIQLCLGGAVLGLLLLWLVPLGAGAALGLGLTGFCLGPISATTMARLSKRITSRLLPTALGFLFGAASLGNALCSWFAGNLAHLLGLGSLLPYELALAAMLLCCSAAL